MDEKIFSYNGDVWTINNGVKKGQYVLRCIAAGKYPDFPISEVRFDMDQLMRNDNLEKNPPANAEKGGKITIYHARYGVEMLRLLAEIAESKRIK